MTISVLERTCGFKIVAFVNGEKKEIDCTPGTGCIKKFVWCGIGVNRAAALLLGRSVKGVEAYVKGDCKGETSSDPPQR